MGFIVLFLLETKDDRSNHEKIKIANWYLEEKEAAPCFRGQYLDEAARFVQGAQIEGFRSAEKPCERCHENVEWHIKFVQDYVYHQSQGTRPRQFD